MENIEWTIHKFEDESGLDCDSEVSYLYDIYGSERVYATTRTKEQADFVRAALRMAEATLKARTACEQYDEQQISKLQLEECLDEANELLGAYNKARAALQPDGAKEEREREDAFDHEEGDK